MISSTPSTQTRALRSPQPIPAGSSQSQGDEEEAGSRDTATDGNFSNMEEEIGGFLVVSSCYRSQEVKAQGNNLMWFLHSSVQRQEWGCSAPTHGCRDHWRVIIRPPSLCAIPSGVQLLENPSGSSSHRVFPSPSCFSIGANGGVGTQSLWRGLERGEAAKSQGFWDLKARLDVCP